MPQQTRELDREKLIHERAEKIWREQGSDLYRPEDYRAIAERMIREEEELGLPVNPYPTNRHVPDRP